jgi:hypothetical protein
MMEYIVYFVTVLGLLISQVVWHRRDERQPNISHGTMYSPLVFCCLVGLIALESAVTHLLEFALIVVFLGICSALYYKGYWRRGVPD